MVNREINFRVWDTAEKQMVYYYQELHEIVMDADGQIYFYDYEMGLCSRPGWKAMQFTDLKDCKEKYICEGDIIKWDETDIGGDAGIGVVEWEDDLTIYPVAGFYVHRPQPHNYNFPLCPEIIGNVYENPELLEKSG